MQRPKLKLAWLYYDLLELYGDRGNIKAFEYICNLNDIDIKVDKITLGDLNDISDYDILFLGGGTDYAQSLLYKDLLSRKEQIIKFLNNNGFALTVCGGYQMFGQYYIGANGEKINGLGIFPYYTDAGTSRCIGNIILDTNLDGVNYQVVGFENHGGLTKGVEHPFGTVKLGNGNEVKSMYEGCLEPGFLGTYLHGPLIPKNPFIAKYIIEYVFKNKYHSNCVIDLDKLKFSTSAHKEVIKREL